MSPHVPRILLTVGTLCLLGGALDPLEGSIVILVGVVLLVAGAWVARTRERTVLSWSLVLVAAGVGALFALSAMGGVGGSTGRSMAWLIVAVPYPVGWVLALIGAWRSFRGSPERRAPA